MVAGCGQWAEMKTGEAVSQRLSRFGRKGLVNDEVKIVLKAHLEDKLSCREPITRIHAIENVRLATNEEVDQQSSELLRELGFSHQHVRPQSKSNH